MHTDTSVHHAIANDRLEEIRQIETEVKRANQVLKDWLVANGGQIVSDQIGCIPARSLVDLPKVISSYEKALGEEGAFGIGFSLGEAQTALKEAKEKGGVVVKDAMEKSEPITGESLTKGMIPVDPTLEPVAQPAQPSFLDELRQLAGKGREDYLAKEAANQEEIAGLKQRLVQVLSKLKGDSLKQILGNNPATLEALTDLVSGLRDIAQHLPGEILAGGQGDGKPDTQFDPKQLAEGTKEEHQEHGGPIEVAKEIAKDHLTEDPNYYADEDGTPGPGNPDDVAKWEVANVQATPEEIQAAWGKARR